MKLQIIGKTDTIVITFEHAMQIFYSRASERWLVPTPDCKLLLNFHLQDNQIKTVIDANVYISSIRRLSYKQCSKIEKYPKQD